MGRKTPTPALLTSTSSPPKLRIDESEQLGDLRMIPYIGGFAGDFTAGLTRKRIDCFIDCVRVRPQMPTCAPRSNNVLAVARPMPRVAPVTRQIFPVRFSMSSE